MHNLNPKTKQQLEETLKKYNQDHEAKRAAESQATPTCDTDPVDPSVQSPTTLDNQSFQLNTQSTI